MADLKSCLLPTPDGSARDEWIALSIYKERRSFQMTES